jgi:hypothetical protein
MRFMIIVRSTPGFEAETRPAPDAAVFTAMATYHEELARAGVLLDGSGLSPAAPAGASTTVPTAAAWSTVPSPKPRNSSPATP